MGVLANIVISAVVGIVATIGAYNYLPLSVIEKFGPEPKQNLGVSITTIQGSDTLKDSRTTINDNFSALNSGKIENSTTSVAAITALPNLTTIGNLTGATTTYLAVTTNASTSRLSVSNGFFQNGFTTGCTGGETETVLYNATTGKFTCGTDSGGSSNWSFESQFAIRPTSTPVGILLSASSTFERLFARFATTTQATTTNITVTGNASTSLLTTSLNCTACPGAYTSSSTAISLSSGTVTFTGSIPGNSTYGLGKYAMSGGGLQGTFTIARSGLTEIILYFVNAGSDDQYTLTWSGNNLTVTEDTDIGVNSTLVATVYWYR